MKISLRWLRQFVSLPAEISNDEIAKRLTMSGLEVELRTPVGRELHGLVVVEVRGKRRHPQADKLNLVDVFDGHTVTQVVCGASNVPEPGASVQVVWAKPGATLPGGITISAKEVRGISSPGMLCAPAELGLPLQSEGLLLLHPEDGFQTGADFAQHAGLPDEIFALNATPNRPDCLGHIGVAREVAVLFAKEGACLTLPQAVHQAGNETAYTVHVAQEATQACRRYLTRVFRQVTVASSPLSQRLLLLTLGLRPINNVVDATQLCMLAWGQPLHAFDLDKIKQNHVVVRMAQPGETLMTLDGETRLLATEDLVIADAEGPIALAGIMGGKRSEVDAETKNVLVESAFFDPITIRKTAKRLKMHTDASHRFERGVDPNEGVWQASAQCAGMLTQWTQKDGEAPVDWYPDPIAAAQIHYTPHHASQVLGIEIPNQVQVRLFAQLGFGVQQTNPDWFVVTIPTFRPDVTRSIDLVEEVGRLLGYDSIPLSLPTLQSLPSSDFLTQAQVRHQLADRARDACASVGLFEVQTLPFSSAAQLALLGVGANQIVRLQNPLREEQSVLRTHLVLGLLEAVQYNHSHGQTKVRLFEVADVFAPGSPPKECTRVAGVISGVRDGFLKELESVDYADLRGLVDEILAVLCQAMPVPKPAPLGSVPWLHPGVAAQLVTEGNVCGFLGEVHPDVCQALGINVPVFAFEFDLPEKMPTRPVFAPLPKHPAAERDISFFVDEAVPVADLVCALQNAQQPLLVDVRVLEEYKEKGKVPAGKKGLLLSLVYRSTERTLRDEEVQTVHDALIQKLLEFPSVGLRV